MNQVEFLKLEHVESLLKSLPIAAIVTDRKGAVKFYNPAFSQLLDNGPELDTQHWYGSMRLYHSDGTPMNHDENPVSLFLKKQQEDGSREDNVTVIAEHEDGERIWVKVTSSWLHHGEEIEDAIHILTNITDTQNQNTTGDFINQKKAHDQLKNELNRKERLYEGIISSTPDLMYIFDLDYRFIFANDALLEMWGLTEDEYIGRDLREIGYEEWHVEMHERELDQIVATKKPIQGEVSFPHDKFGTRYYEYIFVPVVNEEDEVEAIAGTTRDVTERKQAQEELQKMNKTLEERVEERTQSLLSYQEKLRSLVFQLSRIEEKQRQELATELHDNLGQLLALGKMKVNEMKQEQSVEDITPAVENLKGILDEAIRYMRDLASDLKPPPSVAEDLRSNLNWLTDKIAKHGLTVTIDEDEQPKPLNEEVRTITIQCVKELLFNVIKHTSEEEAVVRVRRNEDRVQISVEDEGAGIDKSNKQLNNVTKGKFGLFNIQERIDLLGGHMDIDSTKGRGTKVTLYVPLSKDVSDSAAMKQQKDNGQTKESKQPPKDEKTKVLLVDDHKMFRKGLRKIIGEEDDMTVVGEAGNGEEAVSLSRETSPDVILMDVSMPKMDGIEATWQVKNENLDVRIIGVSLHDSNEVEQDMRDAGATAYLTKTDAFESLVMTIRAEASVAGNK